MKYCPTCGDNDCNVTPAGSCEDEPSTHCYRCDTSAATCDCFDGEHLSEPEDPCEYCNAGRGFDGLLNCINCAPPRAADLW